MGRVTDLIWSPRLERNIGYVWVPIELVLARHHDPGGDAIGGGGCDGRGDPFLDPTKKIRPRRGGSRTGLGRLDRDGQVGERPGEGQVLLLFGRDEQH